MKHFVDLGFSTFTSIPKGRLLGIFIHTFGQKLDWVNVCVDANKSIIHLRQAAQPWSLEGPNNCLLVRGVGQFFSTLELAPDMLD